MVYKYIDVIGTSDTDISAAVDNAFKEASSTVKNIKWGELGRVTFRVEEGKKWNIKQRLELVLKF